MKNIKIIILIASLVTQQTLLPNSCECLTAFAALVSHKIISKNTVSVTKNKSVYQEPGVAVINQKAQEDDEITVLHYLCSYPKESFKAIYRGALAILAFTTVF